MKTFMVNECFFSLQGEGARAGTANVFVRFSGCNLRCDMEPGPLSPGGWRCDTEFVSGRKMTAQEILDEVNFLAPHCKNIVFTGGEPLLQLDEELIAFLKERREFYLSVETNGTVEIPKGIDFSTLSPKVAEHAVVPKKVSELKYVRGYGQGIPKPAALADYYYISPAFEGTELDTRTLLWCVNLVKENPLWRLSVQQHKAWRVR